MSSSPLKLVVIGDGSVGKTCLLSVYVNGSFPTEYVPTIFENYSFKITSNKTEYNFQLWDTAGQEDLGSLRTLSYPNTNVFMICFSVVSPVTFDNILGKWVDELREHGPKNANFLLVGLKADLREDKDTLENLQSQGLTPVTVEKARELAQKIGAVDYIECSAIKCQNVKETFDTAIQIAINPPKEGGCCSIA